MDEPGVATSLGEDLLNPVFLADLAVAEELDR